MALSGPAQRHSKYFITPPEPLFYCLELGLFLTLMRSLPILILASVISVDSRDCNKMSIHLWELLAKDTVRQWFYDS